VDVVALDGEALVVVEVKAEDCAAGWPPAAEGPHRRVDHAKRLRLLGAARFLARSRGLAGRPLRFDVVAVRLEGRRTRCTILRAAFRGSDR
jgi:Holliday junction resolvase-like predicted endonuclease